MLPDEVLRSPAGRTLPHPALRVLVAIAAQYVGTNNGSLSMTRKTAAQYGMGNPHTLDASLRELQIRGLITRTRPGMRIPPRSALFALDWRRIDEPKAHDRHDALPTLNPRNGWARWQPSRPGQHWTTETRRAPRYPRATRPSSAGIHGERKMSSAGIHETASDPAAHGYGSDISGMGARPAREEVS